MTMNIFCVIIALHLTPSHCRGLVIEHQVQDDPPSQLTRFRLTNTEFPFQHVKDLSDTQDQNTTMTNNDNLLDDQNTTMTNNDDNAEDQNTTMTNIENHDENQKITVAGPDGLSDKKSRRSRSVARSLDQSEPSSPAAPPASLVALLALDIIAALFALHALAALLFILQN